LGNLHSVSRVDTPVNKKVTRQRGGKGACADSDDYLVDQAGHQLEIAGRSRQRDLETAWRQKWERLLERGGTGFYLCVTEFETATGRLTFIG
jgi:hypothetical protein